MTAAANIVTNVRTLRLLSMNTLAELAGVPASTISRIESGRLDPTFLMLSRIVAAAGYSLDAQLQRRNDDQPIADYLKRIAGSRLEDQPVKTLLAVAALSPVVKRDGVKRCELTGTLTALLDTLAKQGQMPVISALEAYSEKSSEIMSFNPIIYVDNPAKAGDLKKATPRSKQVILLLPTTDNVQANASRKGRVRMVSPEWGLLDALASPGRQPDAALEALAAKGQRR
jgi:transcriptional regulator with XRE-family HTH domain